MSYTAISSNGRCSRLRLTHSSYLWKTKGTLKARRAAPGRAWASEEADALGALGARAAARGELSGEEEESGDGR
eukprot:scaffold97128_cov28-Tisochrysis_lutea.AAC.1